MATVEPALAHRLRLTLGRLSRRMRSVETNGMSWSQGAVLGRLENDGETTAAALAAAEGVRPQSMAATLDILEGDGLVERRPDEKDRRQLRVSITEQGRTMVRSARASKEQWLAQAIGKHLTCDEAEILRTAVDLLERLAEDEAKG